MPDDEQPDSYRDLDRTASVEATRVIERGASFSVRGPTTSCVEPTGLRLTRYTRGDSAKASAESEVVCLSEPS